MRADELVLGIDGGGAKTIAWLSPRHVASATPIRDEPLGRGSSGPANPQVVGFDKAREHLERAVDQAFVAANVKRAPVSAACAAIAGVLREDDRRQIERWAEQRRLARRFVITHDAQHVLAAGAPQGWGIALIAGATSFAFGRNVKGRSARVGGWGHLIGDEGSAYSLALAGLRAVARAEDGRGKSTRLTSVLLSRLSLACPTDLVPALYGGRLDRASLSELAPCVLDAAGDGDEAAVEVVESAASDLAAMVQALAVKLNLAQSPFPLAITGGVLLHGEVMRKGLGARLNILGLSADPTTAAPDPVAGAVKIARAEAQA